MTIQEAIKDRNDDIKLNYVSKTGHTYNLDYMIEPKNYFGKGHGAKTLSRFIDFFRREFDLSADAFIRHPARNNVQAKHAYIKAGFKHGPDFIMGGHSGGAGKTHHLLIKRFTLPSLKLC